MTMTATASQQPSIAAIMLVALFAACAFTFAPHAGTMAMAVSSSATDSAFSALGNCLTPKQDSELKKAIAGIQVTLNAAIVSLDIAAAAEHNANTRKELIEAAHILKEVSVYLVANLTKIAESACGNCSEIVQVVNETVVAIEQTLSNIDPNWRHETVWKVVVAVVNDILAIVELVCPNKSEVAIPVQIIRERLGDPCLNSSQIALLEKITAGIQIVLTTAEIALEVAEREETNPTVKKDLEEAIVIIKAISQDLIANLTKIAKSPCATCTDIVNMVNQAVNDIEAALTRINPQWQNDPLWKSIVSAIQEILNYIKVICPNHAGRPHLPRNPMPVKKTLTFVH